MSELSNEAKKRTAEQMNKTSDAPGSVLFLQTLFRELDESESAVEFMVGIMNRMLPRKNTQV